MHQNEKWQTLKGYAVTTWDRTKLGALKQFSRVARALSVHRRKAIGLAGIVFVLSNWKGNEMLGVQTLVILVSVLILWSQHSQQVADSVADARVLAQRQQEERQQEQRYNEATSVRDTMEHLRHSTTAFRAAERSFLHSLILHALKKHERGTEYSKLLTEPEGTSIGCTIKDAYIVWNRRAAREWRDDGQDQDQAERLFGEELSKDREYFLERMRKRERGIESITALQARIFNSCFATQSYVREMLTHYELLGVGTFENALAFSPINKASGTQIVDAFLRWETFVYEHRSRPRKRSVFNYFQLLASLIVHSRAQEIIRSIFIIGDDDDIRIEMGELCDVDPESSTLASFEGSWPSEECLSEADRYWLRQASKPQFSYFATEWENVDDDLTMTADEREVGEEIHLSDDYNFEEQVQALTALVVSPNGGDFRLDLPQPLRAIIEFTSDMSSDGKRVECWAYGAFMRRYRFCCDEPVKVVYARPKPLGWVSPVPLSHPSVLSIMKTTRKTDDREEPAV